VVIRARVLSALPIAGLVLASCANILGIEEASVDPTFEADEYGSGSTGTGTASSALCEAYCASVMANCQGEDAVYKTDEICLAVCAALPAGTPGDSSENSIECRKRNADSASAEPAYYCPSAGPGGNGVCGANCEGLCTIGAAICTGISDGWSPEGCLAACASVPDLGTYSVAESADMYAGDHVQCRLYHLSSASVGDPDKHCEHAAGAAPCAP
jgi:hypothetical protein